MTCHIKGHEYRVGRDRARESGQAGLHRVLGALSWSSHLGIRELGKDLKRGEVDLGFHFERSPWL